MRDSADQQPCGGERGGLASGRSASSLGKPLSRWPLSRFPWETASATESTTASRRVERRVAK